MTIRFVAVTALLIASACARQPLSPARDAGVNRLFANVRGVT